MDFLGAVKIASVSPASISSPIQRKAVRSLARAASQFERRLAATT